MLKNFEEKITNIQNELHTLGYAIVESNKIAIEAVKSKEDDGFAQAKAVLNSIEEKASNIDNLIVGALALHQAEAKYLRELVSYLKITNEIVRAAGSTKNFIRTFCMLIKSEIELNEILEYTVPLHRSSISAFETAIDMIKETDLDKVDEAFHRTAVDESKTEDLYSMIEKNVLKMISKKHELSKEYFDILRAIRRLDKVAGRALSIANLVIYAEMGGELNKV